VTKTIVTNPRALVLALISVGLLLGLFAGSAIFSPGKASADGHVTGLETIVASKAIVDHELGKRSSKKSVMLYGSGFAPGQEVILMVNDGPGTPSDITGFTSNKSKNGTMVANDHGAWATKWKIGRFTRKRSGIGPGDGDIERMRSMSAVNPANFQVITTAPLAFCRITDHKKANAAADKIEDQAGELEEAITAFGTVTRPESVSADVWTLLETALNARAASIQGEADAAKAAIKVKGHCPS